MHDRDARNRERIRNEGRRDRDKGGGTKQGRRTPSLQKKEDKVGLHFQGAEYALFEDVAPINAPNFWGAFNVGMRSM